MILKAYFISFSFLYLKCNVLTSCWCSTLFSCVYTKLILFSFSGLQYKIITSCCYHQLYLVKGMQHWIVMLLIIEKVTYRVLMEIISATIDFSNPFAFQIRVSNVVPVHHPSSGLYSHSCLKVTCRVLIEIMSASIDCNLFAFQIRVVVEICCSSSCTTFFI
jgi:hypothetical protein